MADVNEWTPLSTRFFRDPKVVAAGKDAALLYLAGLCYAQEHLTDGFLPTGAVAVLRAEAGASAKAARALVDAELWEEAPGGYRVRGWLNWNRSRDDVEHNRRVDAERKREWRRRKAAKAGQDPGRDTSRDAGRDTSRDEDAVRPSRSARIRKARRCPLPGTSHPRLPPRRPDPRQPRHRPTLPR